MQSAAGGGRSLYALAALVGAFFFFATFGFDFVRGVGGIWDEGRQDLATQIVGLRYFVSEPWRFPLFDVKDLAFPAGTNIVYTDSIPIVALVTKLFAPVVGTKVNPYGMWLLLCWVLQPVAAVYALRSMGVTAPLPTVCVAVLSLFVPAWIRRFGHLALCGHFLILLALGSYLRARQWSWIHTTLAWTALLSAALLVHPYLMFMSLPLLGAALLQFGRISLKSASVAAGMGALICLALVALMYVSGHFSSFGRSSGFGHHSMNLASPFWPQRSGLFPLMSSVVDATGGQYEGFNYVGAGLLGLFVSALIVGWRYIGGGIRSHWPLLLAVLVLTAVALSNRVYFFDQLLVDFGKVPDILQQVRASGRFFWPVTYSGLILGAAVLVTMLGPRAAVVMAGLMGLQLLDASPSRVEIANRTRNLLPISIDAATWQQVIAQHDRVSIMPSFDCTPRPISGTIEQLIFAASATSTPVDSVYVARPRDVDCSAPPTANLAEGTLVVSFSLPGALSVGDLRSCRALDGTAVCSERWSDLAADLRDRFASFEPSDYSMEPGSTIAFDRTATGFRLLGHGWRRQEDWGVWAGADAATAAMFVPGPAGSRATLDFELSVRAEQRVGVYANGSLAGVWDFPASDLGVDCCTRSVTVPASDAPLALEFRVEPPASGGSSEQTLTIGLKSVTRRVAPS